MIVQHPARPAPAIVIVLRDGSRQRFSASAIKENMAVNQQRSRLLRRGKAELAPRAHPLGRALLEAEEASLSPSLKVAAKQQRCLETLLSKSRAAKRGRPRWRQVPSDRARGLGALPWVRASQTHREEPYRGDHPTRPRVGCRADLKGPRRGVASRYEAQQVAIAR